jgi:hypothetical protein
MKPFKPEIVKLKSRKVLTVTTIGDPNKVKPGVSALFGTAYGTKFKVFKPKGKKMDIGVLAARWPDAHLKPKSKWKGIWALQVPDFVKQSDLLQKDPAIKVEKWPYGKVAQVLYLGAYKNERPTIMALHKFVKESGFKLAGPHEEEYLTMPTAKVPKTIIRYAIKK